MAILIILTVGGFILYLVQQHYSKQIDKKHAEEIKSVLTPEEFEKKYNSIQEGNKIGGALCFYGHWFGRPYDNYHKLTKVIFNSQANSLTMIFDESEQLIIEHPNEINEYSEKLTIQSATRIYWQWYSYGKNQSKNNLYSIEITRERDQLKGKSDVDWYKPNFKDLTIDQPALSWI